MTILKNNLRILKRYLFPFKYIDASTHISKKHNYIYVSTPKVACSTIILTLQRMELDDTSFNRDVLNDIHRPELSPLLRPSVINDFKRLVISDDMIKFCFVRNPYTRLLSAYFFVLYKSKKPEVYMNKLGFDSSFKDKKITFNQFVNAIKKQPIAFMDWHWKPQYYLTVQRKINYDFIGRFETFQEDFKYIMSKINPEHEKYLISVQSHKTDSDELLHQYYNPEIEEEVYNIYKKDFELFKYDRMQF